MSDLPQNSEQGQLDPWLSRLLGGKYRVVARLGAGGMGVAYRAWDTERGLPVVVKVPKKVLLEDPKFAERFHREIRMVQGIAHPRVVPIVAVGEDEGVPYVVMRFLPGGALANRRLRNAEGQPAANPPGMLHLWLPQIADALDHVHGLGIVHRDVKPENIFFDARWGAFLGDFGIAKIVEESAAFSRDQTLTATSMAIGTQQYMAPEQFQPKAAVDGRTDQYALAVTVYEVLSGERPFRGETSNLIVEIMTTPAPSLAARRPKLPPSLVAAVQRALSKRPDQRFDSCLEFVDAVLNDVKELPDEPDIARLMCPNCGNILKLRPDAAGRKGNCPKCRVPMRVARDLESLWVAGEDGGKTGWNTGSGSGGTSRSGGFKTISGGVAAWPSRGRIKKALGRMVTGPGWVLALSALVAGVLCIAAAPAIVAWMYSQAPPAGQVAGGTQSPTGTAPPAAEVSTETEEPPPTPVPPAVADPLGDARAALERSPQDRVAHGVVGRILCFRQERWDEGLKHLAQCDTPALATIARKEIDARTQPAEARPGELLRVAKAWWDLGQGGFLPEAESAAVGHHSVDLYEQVVGAVSQHRDLVTANEWLDRDDTFRVAVNNVRPQPSADLPPSTEPVTKPSLVNSIGIELKLIPPGTFMMGSEDGDTDERPVHEVRITKPFYLGVYEVTNAQWKAVMGTEPPSKWKDDDRPVVQVSWDDATAFCEKLSAIPEERRAGRVYRLPTEAEWEYACRAGTNLRHWFGNDEKKLADVAWFNSNADGQTNVVGQKLRNPWGLHDVHGNVWEWCNDRYGPYENGLLTDPSGLPESHGPVTVVGGGTLPVARVLRGGGWLNPVFCCRSADRYGHAPTTRNADLGFRLALSEPEPDQPNQEQHPGGDPEAATTTVNIPPLEREQEAKPSAAAQEIIARPPIDNSIGMKLKPIPAGTFMMGSENGGPDEKPVHEVRITKPFYIGVYEVTNAQWKAVMGREPPSKWKEDDRPVEMVSWVDAIAFCQKLSNLSAERTAGRVYRLPTEAEWEYACRAGAATRWSSGDDEKALRDFAWFDVNAAGQTHSVGLKRPNPWGLYDTHGNVWEWCSDRYGPYPSEAVTDPLGPTRGSARVGRGGSWLTAARICRSALRGLDEPSSREHDVGFRLAMSLSGTDLREPGQIVGNPSPPNSPAAPAGNAAEERPSSRSRVPNEIVNAAATLARPPAENSIGMKLKLIPPGTFMMGSNDGDPDEMPVHEVEITKPFHLGVYEVTNAQWQAVMGRVPSAWRGDNHPVEQVSWTDAIAFCRTLTALPAERAAGRVYRLPTEAEWEYACRAGTKSEFSFGGDRSLLPDHAWFSSNSGGQTRPVGLKKPNPWGLYDMHGNVWEWCGDGYGPFTEGVATDPTGLATAAVKVYRGGNWGYVARECRSAKRKSIDPEHRDHYRGFRVAMNEQQQR